MGKAKIKTTITKRVEQVFAEDEVENILIEYFRAKEKLEPEIDVNLNFDVSQSGGFLRGVTIYYEDTIVEERLE